jgi:adenylate kinase family enzyme
MDSSSLPPRVVFAITGPPGSGKTFLCSQLLQCFPEAAYLSMDDYQIMTAWSQQELLSWMAAGADYEELPMPGLCEALARLKFQHHPAGSAVEPSSSPIFFESHLGKHTIGLTALVDYVIWIDQDLDICLARALRAMCRQQRGARQEGSTETTKIQSYLDHYLITTSALLRMQRERIRPTADYLLIDQSVTKLSEWIHAKIASAEL